MKFFATEFGFNATEVVALMGVHTLGSAKETNSGFKVDRAHEENSGFKICPANNILHKFNFVTLLINLISREVGLKGKPICLTTSITRSWQSLHGFKGTVSTKLIFTSS